MLTLISSDGQLNVKQRSSVSLCATFQQTQGYMCNDLGLSYIYNLAGDGHRKDFYFSYKSKVWKVLYRFSTNYLLTDDGTCRKIQCLSNIYLYNVF